MNVDVGSKYAQEVVNHPEVEIIVIDSPNEALSTAAAALHEGKQVVVDKPFNFHLRRSPPLFNCRGKRSRALRISHIDVGT